MSPTPSQKQGMVGAGFPEMGEGPPPGRVTGAGVQKCLPVTVSHGTEGRWLPRDKGLW